ncbi:MAG TPA: Mov34/MPN/PAD-1 family protein, partial [Candidatus Dormibacteraeota bacterium]|nr:Mov34/MPN/PAD-1 family protein [Candidatus Dormibacteraeota bacterium]
LRAERGAREAGLEVLGFWHSHPDHPAVPSRLDTERAWAEYLYVIVSSSAGGTGDVRGWRLLPGADGFGEVGMAVDGVAAEAGR